MLLLSAGRECTDLFNSYHWSNPDKPRKFLSTYEIGTLTGPTEFPVFAPDTSGFYRTLSKRIKEHFDTTGKNPKSFIPGAWRLLLQISIGLTMYCISVGILLPETTLMYKFLAAAIYGIFQVMPLLHAMHDASHTAIGSSEGFWKFFGRITMDWYAGSSMISWHHQHIVGHHVYTNVFMADPDIPYRPNDDLRRIVPDQIMHSVYALQWIYLPFLYGFLAFKVRMTDIFDTWLKLTSGPIRVNFYDSVFIRIFLVKGLWAAWRIYYPLFVLKMDYKIFWFLFFVTELASGFWLAWNFEVSHLAPEADFPRIRNADGNYSTSTAAAEAAAKKFEAELKKQKAGVPIVTKETNTPSTTSGAVQKVIPRSWAQVQVESSVDYGHDSWWTAWWCGALNYQIEHHLFPGISQYHYPALAPIVQQTCKEFNIRYNYEPSFWDAWTSHIKLLYDMGQKGQPYHWD